jgi:hypothetical protein
VTILVSYSPMYIGIPGREMKTDYEFSDSPCCSRLSQLPATPAGAFVKTEKDSIWDLKPWPAGSRFWAPSDELICSDEEET